MISEKVRFKIISLNSDMRKLFFCILFFPILGHAQVYLKNPSFEDIPSISTLPKHWITCDMGSTPDILPGPWGVQNPPADGGTYVGLILRENGSKESIAQRLDKPLKANECYYFSAYLARSTNYQGHLLPVRLKIWGSQALCRKDQLLIETKAIKNTEWVRYDFQFYPKSDIHCILIEPVTAPGVQKSYKGNILIDGFSAFQPCQRAELATPHPLRSIAQSHRLSSINRR